VSPAHRNTWAPVAALLAAAILLTLIAVNLMTLAGINSNRPLIVHMRAVQALLLQTRAALVDAETGRRGFLLLGERAYLEPLDRAEKSLPAILSELRSLHLDDPSRQRRIEELERLASATLADVRRTVDLHEQGQREAALATVRNGAAILDAARRVIGQLRDEEDQQLEQRTAAAVRNLEIAMWMDVSAGVGLIVLGLLLYAINRDIARREALEAALRDSVKFQEQFIGILGHDLRNPLNAISVGADLLLRKEMVAQNPQATLRRIASSAARMRRMVDQLLDLTRARLAGGIPVRPTPGTNLAEVARGAVEELRVAHPEAQLTLLAAAQISGEWDADRMAQVVSNLVGNAISHGAGGPVHVQVKGAHGSAILEVHNGGSPIPADLLPRIFDPFRQATQTPATATHGLGLGLFITRQIVLAHGGTIDVVSAQPEGTTFKVVLPSQRIQTS
jgi:signal transduction histidine kinase